MENQKPKFEFHVERRFHGDLVEVMPVFAMLPVTLAAEDKDGREILFKRPSVPPDIDVATLDGTILRCFSDDSTSNEYTLRVRCLARGGDDAVQG